MNKISNDCFADYPIDYFKFAEADFNRELSAPEYKFSIDELEVERGFIGSSIYEKVNFEKKETVVVNCAVGQGKTSGILNSIKEFLATESSVETYFVIAVPLVSLVTQYKKDLLEMGFEEEQIFSYEQISDTLPNDAEGYLQSNCQIHIVTVNTLLGNPGEDAILQSDRKYNYIRNFAEQLSIYGKKLIVLYDEIHEAISNFTKVGIGYMGHFSSVLLKNIVLSATFNVQSIPVLKMLAKQTNNEIRILESPRVVVKEQSKLFLHYDNNYNKDNIEVIKRIITDALSREKTIDILSYSKKLCKNILNTNNELGSLLFQKFGVLQDCTSSINGNEGDNDEDLNRNRFDNDYCNIGTNFKSGVNITKENHCFIVILPPKSSRSTYKNFNGIFSEGINAVIQALARQRTNGEIHIVLPKPIAMDYNSLPEEMTAEQRERFEEFYNQISILPNEIETTNNVEVTMNKYKSFSDHIGVVRGIYEKLEERFEMPRVLSNGQIKVVDFDDFNLSYGGRAISRDSFLGRDLASFTSYAAFTNQFFNTRLEDYFFPEVFSFEEIPTQIPVNYSSLDPSLSIDEKFRLLTNMFDLGGLSSSQKRTINQFMLRHVVDNESNVFNISEEECDSSTRFVISYFNCFTNQNPLGLENEIKSLRDRVEENLISIRSVGYFKKYEISPIFLGEAMRIKDIISRLRLIYPLDKDFANFFRNHISDLNDIIEKKFYYFLIDTKCHNESCQLTIGGTRQYYRKIIRRF